MRKDTIAAILETLRYRGNTLRREDRQALAEAAALIRTMAQKNEMEWIPVAGGELPPERTRVEAKILHHRWITDVHENWVMEEDLIEHPEYIETCEAIYLGEESGWRYQYLDAQDLFEDTASIAPAPDISQPVVEILAWRPMPEPYKGRATWMKEERGEGDHE